MSTAVFLAEPGAVAAAREGDVVDVSGAEGRHAVTVRRIATGELIDLVDGSGTLLHTRVESVTGRDHLRARVLRREVQAVPQPRVVVVQALPKGDRGETAVETLTEVGVDLIVPWQAERCIARWHAERAVRGRAKWVAAARAASKQARRAWVPDVADVASSTDVQDMVRDAATAIVLHESADQPWSDAVVAEAGDVVLVVGPEGGVSSGELEMFIAAGAQVARLGPTVLRTSTAGTVAAALVLARTGRWA